MNNKVILPLEIINKILIMRPTHLLAEIMKEEVNYYNEYIDGDYDILFNEYIIKLKHLYVDFNIRKTKNINNVFCDGCNKPIIINEHFYRNSHSINCINCF